MRRVTLPPVVIVRLWVLAVGTMWLIAAVGYVA